MKFYRPAVFTASIILALLFLCSPTLALADKIDTKVSAGLDPSIRSDIQKVVDTLQTAPQIETVEINRKKVRQYIDDFKTRIDTVEKELKQLSTALEGTDAIEVSENSKDNPAFSETIQLKQQRELELVELRLLLMTSEEIIQQLDQYILRQEKNNLFLREAPFWQAFLLQADPNLKRKSTELYLSVTPGFDRTLLSFACWASIVMLLSLITKVKNFITSNTVVSNSVHLIAVSFSDKTFFHRIFLLLVNSLIIFLYLFPPIAQEQPLVSSVVTLFFMWLVLIILIKASLLKLQKKGAESEIERIRNHCSITSHFFAIMVAITIIAGSLHLPEFLHANIVMILSLNLNIVWLVAVYFFTRTIIVRQVPDVWRFAKIVTGFFSLLIIGLEVFGYRVLSDWLVFNIGYSFVIVGIAYILFDSVFIFTSILRMMKSYIMELLRIAQPEDRKTLNASNLLRFGLKAVIFAGTALYILHQWEMINIEGDRLQEFLSDGIKVGQLTFSPARFLAAFILFSVAWPAMDTLKKIIDKYWLESAELTRGSRENVLTIVGYGGYAVIILLVLSLAGIQLTGLTVIIGALSVGIGFGLQNVVNNFISGLILMFEQPVKKGDWIKVGTTEGYVKKISIRSTIVQTFDRSDVIVPNSELISNQVTNMMYDDLRGRVRVSVGVSYGSDIDLVKELLLETAKSHNQIITDGSAPQPRVIFQAFGDSSLNFDMLCHIKDVDQILTVRSELNFRVNKIFRENSVEIPFPQRDVHLKNKQ